MRKKEWQLLAALAVIAGGIVALSMWSGNKDVSGEKVEEPPERPTAEQTRDLRSDELDDFLDILIRDTRPGAQQGAGARSKPQDAAFLDTLKRDGLHFGTEDPLSAPPGKTISDELAETAPEEIPLQKRDDEDTQTAEEKRDTPETVTHTVQKGDTLSEISQQYYGTSRKWKDILEANKNVLDSPEQLRPDMTLQIPGVHQVGRRKSTDTQPALSAQTGEKYTVQKGDTLWSIAVNHYNDGSRYRDVLRANREAISDADDLRAGMVINIP